MRELKFRAWDKDNERMLYFMPFTGVWDCEGNTVIEAAAMEEPKTGRAPGVNSVLMQYTGLKDKNGVEVYEGDIVVASWNGGGCVGAISWSENNCLFGVHIGEIYEGLNGLTSIEVIGNIYENPELLK